MTTSPDRDPDQPSPTGRPDHAERTTGGHWPGRPTPWFMVAPGRKLNKRHRDLCWWKGSAFGPPSRDDSASLRVVALGSSPWDEPLRQHRERLTATDRAYEDAAKALSETPPPPDLASSSRRPRWSVRTGVTLGGFHPARAGQTFGECPGNDDPRHVLSSRRLERVTGCSGLSIDVPLPAVASAQNDNGGDTRTARLQERQGYALRRVRCTRARAFGAITSPWPCSVSYMLLLPRGWPHLVA
jgi:hypothetical protein